MSGYLSFSEFIKINFPYYQIDPTNEGLIDSLSAWANGEERFCEMGEGFQIEKGILLMGDIGVGKTDLFRLLHEYLKQNPRRRYDFTYHVVWKFASEFSKHGHEVFDGHESGNRYYDELCLINGKINQPLREYATYYGNKLLVGEELIMFRYNCFKFNGWQSHFSTNATPAQMKEVYDERVFSRLTEMCNFMDIVGEDRRGKSKATLYLNQNEPVKKEKPLGPPVTDEEHQYNKNRMDEDYQEFVLKREIAEYKYSINYQILKSYGCDLGSDSLLVQYADEVSSQYVAPSKIINDLKGKPIHLSIGKNEVAYDKYIETMNYAKKRCVYEFYMRLKEGGCKSIFGEVGITMNANKPEDLKT